MKPTSLVTGGAGFIGAHVVNELIDLGHDVIVLDDLSGGQKENVNTSAELIIGSITDEKLVNDLFAKYKFTYVYHLAAYAAEGLSHYIRRFNYHNNVIGSINLINASVKHDIKHFVFTSSIAVYGTGKLPLTEDQFPQPEDPYGIAKYTVEMDLHNAHKMFGLNFTVFRPHNVYGPFQNINDPYRNVIGIFMKRLLQGKALPVFGNGEQKRAFTFIDDIAPYIAQCVNIKNSKNEVFNIGSDEVSTIKQLALKVGEAFERETSLEHLPQREEVFEAYSDHSKFIQAFQPAGSTNLKVGLQKMASWVKNTTYDNQSSSIPIEIEKNFPESWKGITNK